MYATQEIYKCASSPAVNIALKNGEGMIEAAVTLAYERTKAGVYSRVRWRIFDRSRRY